MVVSNQLVSWVISPNLGDELQPTYITGVSYSYGPQLIISCDHYHFRHQVGILAHQKPIDKAIYRRPIGP